MSAAHAELDTAIERAVSSLDTAIIENRLHDDPIRLVLVGLIQTLRAQRQLHAAANADMARHLEQARVALEEARQPVQDKDLERAVTRGVGTYAMNLVTSIRFGAVAGLAGVGLVLGLIGFGLGGWWQYDRMATEVETQDHKTERIMVEAKELGSVVLSAKSAAIWTELVHLNPNVTDAMRQLPIPQATGRECLPIADLDVAASTPTANTRHTLNRPSPFKRLWGGAFRLKRQDQVYLMIPLGVPLDTLKATKCKPVDNRIEGKVKAWVKYHGSLRLRDGFAG